MENGGARKGAGRPKGSFTTPRFSQYVTDEERQKFADWAVEHYQKDMRLALWMGDQLFGKPLQAVDVKTEDVTPERSAVQELDGDWKHFIRARNRGTQG